jgi:hypothetical protein
MLRDRIHPSCLDQPIRYPSHFCCTGWGFRRLSSNELSQVFGLPMMCRIGGLEHHEFEMLIPVQLLHAVLDEYMTSSSTHPTRVLAQPSFLRLPLYRIPCATRSWIGALGRWLSHEWIDNTEVTSKAAKRDDAAIATDMWNKRLILLYPHCSVLHLDVLRTWLLCRVRRRVLRELCMYLSQRFGGDWFLLLSAGRKWVTIKRDNLSASSRFQGGLGLTLDSARLGLDLLSYQLLEQAERGVDVLTRFTDASWWEWTPGSALVFWRWGNYSDLALDGCLPFMLSDPPRFKKGTPTPSNEKRSLIAEKLRAIIERGYLVHGRVQSLIQFFDVPKADYI